jgi:hypothetical protein
LKTECCKYWREADLHIAAAPPAIGVGKGLDGSGAVRARELDGFFK